MKYYSPAEGITRAIIPLTENKPEMPVLFGREGHPCLRLESCELTLRPVYRTMETDGGKLAETANGEVMTLSGKGREEIRQCRQAVLTFSCRNGQVLTGLGQHERGILNYAREKEWLYAHNMKIPVPFVLGSDGWGLLADTECAAVFTGLGGGFRLELNAVDELSLTFIEGRDCGQVIRRLSRLAGLPAMLPKWVFGYIQSKEWYRSAEELIRTTREFRERKLGLDCIVLDWMSWKDGFWVIRHRIRNAFRIYRH